MSKPKPTVISKQLAAVDHSFDSLRAALIQVISTLTEDQQAAISAALDIQIDETHQAIVTQVRQLAELSNSQKDMATTDTAEEFDQSIYNQKIQNLLSFASTITYTAARNLPRDTEWTRTVEYFKHKLGKFFKIAFVYADDQSNGQKWMQALVIQEFDQYDKHACNKEIGDNILPLRIHNGQIEAAITLRNPPGSFGQTVFVSPRCSNSTTQKTVFRSINDSLYSRHQRADMNRLTGRAVTRVVFVDQDLEKQIDYAQEKIVWFSIPELKRLLDEPQTEDSATITLIQWVLLHASQLQQSLNPAQDKA